VSHPTLSPPELREALRPFGRRFAFATLYFLVSSLIGTAGYVAIEGWEIFDAFYMSVTTLTSVGFMEVYPLSPAGRSFTMVVIVLGVTGLGIYWGLITAMIVELDLGGLLRRRRMMRRISDLSDHFIVCGAGRIGRIVSEEMLRDKTKFVLIESDAARVRALIERHPDLLILEGDATREHTLQTARIDTARGLAACLASDADNLLLCLTARGLKPDICIVARANEMESIEKLRRAGATHSISPSVTGGIRMASVLLRPTVVSLLDVAAGGVEIDLRLEEVVMPAASPLVGQTLAEARIPQRTGLVVIALRSDGGKAPPSYNPGPDARLGAGDIVIVLGRAAEIEVLRRYVQSGAAP
jgi:voltage-gated potassium channel